MPSKTNKDIEWENRTLCSDESCIGVIGKDGRCKECGKTYEGTLTVSTSAETVDSLDQSQETAPLSAPEVEDQAEAQDVDFTEDESEIDEEWEQRKLCSDESCIGVIGTDGRCKECGKPYESD